MRHPQLLESNKMEKKLKVEYVELENRPLVFDVFGPFAIHFQEGPDGKEGTATICAPLCPDHHANLLTDTDDVSVMGQSKQGEHEYVYSFSAGRSPKGASRFSRPIKHDIFRVPSKTDKFSFEIKDDIAKSCHLVFKVPMPNRIEALRPEPSWVHRNGSDIWVIDRDRERPTSYVGADPDPKNLVDSKRGRGLRLIYDECCKAPDFDLPDDQGLNPAGLTAATKGFPVGKIPTYYGITLRFAAIHATGDGVDDAHSCFQTMRTMLDKYLKTDNFSRWRADFVQPDVDLVIASMSGPRPHDCGAMVLAMQDWTEKTSK
jgi:hypothetical protein